MSRKSLCVALAALLFNAFIISCKKDTAIQVESIGQANEPIASQAKKSGTDPLNAAVYDLLGVPIYEYYNSARQDRLLTPDANFSSPGWSLVGTSFRGATSFMSHTFEVGIYQYVNNVLGDHAYSPDPNDQNILGYPDWQREGTGPVFYVLPEHNVVVDIPVYHYYNASETSNLYTSNSRIHLDYPGWVQTGIAWRGGPMQ